MKRKLLFVLSYPLVLVIGWIATRLSESYELSLDQLEFDFE